MCLWVGVGQANGQWRGGLVSVREDTFGWIQGVLKVGVGAKVLAYRKDKYKSCISPLA